MQSFDELARELEKDGKSARVKALAESADGQRLEQLVDRDALERAARAGDTKALGAILSEILNTAEGKRLAAGVQELFKGK